MATSPGRSASHAATKASPAVTSRKTMRRIIGRWRLRARRAWQRMQRRVGRRRRWRPGAPTPSCARAPRSPVPAPGACRARPARRRDPAVPCRGRSARSPSRDRRRRGRRPGGCEPVFRHGPAGDRDNCRPVRPVAETFSISGISPVSSRNSSCGFGTPVGRERRDAREHAWGRSRPPSRRPIPP